MKQHTSLNDEEDDQEISIPAAREISNQIICSSSCDVPEVSNKSLINQTHPDVISLELNMPVMHGQQVLSTISVMRAAKTVQYLNVGLSSNKKSPSEK